jgi:hypothetical protein
MISRFIARQCIRAGTALSNPGAARRPRRPERSMAIPGNPRQFARDVADGFFVFNRATCRQFPAKDLQTLYRLIEQVARELRAEQVPLEDVVEVQRKNQRLSRANNALMFIRNHAKRHKIVL